MNLALTDVEIPGGERFEHHVVRAGADASGTVVADPDRGVLLLWRHRFITDTWGWEVPAGRVDAGETPADAAARETLEETGWRAGPLTFLCTYHPNNGQTGPDVPPLPRRRRHPRGRPDRLGRSGTGRVVGPRRGGRRPAGRRRAGRPVAHGAALAPRSGSTMSVPSTSRWRTAAAAAWRSASPVTFENRARPASTAFRRSSMAAGSTSARARRRPTASPTSPLKKRGGCGHAAGRCGPAGPAWRGPSGDTPMTKPASDGVVAG